MEVDPNKFVNILGKLILRNCIKSFNHEGQNLKTRNNYLFFTTCIC